jgi:1-aminocyclopropane-1-carboxylate deaminase
MHELLNTSLLLPPPLTRLQIPGLPPADVLRLDLLHPVISGNKWFKLKYGLEAAKNGHYPRITTFGGAFSNHIAATAFACHEAGIPSRGIIRGEAGDALSPTLEWAKQCGMHIEYMDRQAFRELRNNGFHWPGAGADYLIPEGGAYTEGVRGAKEILDFVSIQNYTHVLCAIGTGTTAAGILSRLPESCQLVCVNVLKGGSFQEPDIIRFSETAGANLVINNEFHFGGYARHTPLLIGFMNRFFMQTAIPTDFVYTAKLFYAWEQLCQAALKDDKNRVLIIHSGGIQGNLSLPKGTLIF